MVKRKRANRTTDMDKALYEALKTGIPPKDTGPDPDDILAGLFEDELQGNDEPEEKTERSGSRAQVFQVELDEDGLAHAQQIVDLIKAQRGEPISIVEALKVALYGAPLDRDRALEAFDRLGSTDDKK